MADKAKPTEERGLGTDIAVGVAAGAASGAAGAIAQQVIAKVTESKKPKK